MAKDLVVVGAGGFGRETLDVVDALNAAAERPQWNVLGVADDSPADRNLELLRARGAAYLGATEELAGRLGSAAFVVAIGNPFARRKVAARLESMGLEPVTLIHPAATVGATVSIGAGTIICAGARVTTNIRIGRHVHLNPNVTVGHDTVLGDFVSMNPASSVSGDCVMGDAVLVGVGAVILNQLTVGSEAVIGGAACVVKDVVGGAIVKGVPAR